MKKLSSLFPFMVMVLLFFSCQKELSVDTINNNGNNNTTLIGDWRFIDLYMDVSSTATGNIPGATIKTITTYSTTSIKNTGAITFTSDKFTVTDMGFSISDTARVTSYIMGTTTNEYIEFGGDIPPYDGSGKYQKIGTDSLYFPDGSVFQGLEIDGQEITSSNATGAKYAIKSDTLFVFANVIIAKDTIVKDDNTGINIKFRVDQKATTIGSFKKK